MKYSVFHDKEEHLFDTEAEAREFCKKYLLCFCVIKKVTTD